VAVSVAAELSSINYRDTAILTNPTQPLVYLRQRSTTAKTRAVDFLPALRGDPQDQDIKRVFGPLPAAAHSGSAGEARTDGRCLG
jgi:hypothetical protein